MLLPEITAVQADVAEWQTHKTQNLAGATSCGFKSHHPHSGEALDLYYKKRSSAILFLLLKN